MIEKRMELIDQAMKKGPASAATDNKAIDKDTIYYSNLASIYATKLDAIKAVLEAWFKAENMYEAKLDIIKAIIDGQEDME